MPSSLDQALITLAQGFTVALGNGTTSWDFIVRLVQPAGTQRLTVTDLVTETVLKDGKVDILWTTKDVRFVNTNITDTNVVGGMPVSGLLPLGAANVTLGPPNPPGVPGVLGALNGTVPIPVVGTVAKTLDVSVELHWRIRDEHGTIDSDVKWNVDNTAPQAAGGVGGDISIPLADSLFPLLIIFNVLFVELTNNTPQNPVVKRSIQASIRLSAGGASSGWVDLPTLDLLLPAIPVPTIAMFFEHVNFAGLGLVVVPADSPLDPLDNNVVQTALGTLNGVIAPLQGIAGFLSFFVGQLGPINTALNNSPRLTFRKTNEIPNLRDVEIEPTSWRDWNGTVASDEFSSLMLIGPPHRQLQCFNDTDYQEGQGRMNVTLASELLVESTSLQSTAPPSSPSGRITVPRTPAGWNWSLARWITKFGDEISSIRFGWE